MKRLTRGDPDDEYRADLFTVEQWHEAVAVDFFIHEDGSGYWATAEEYDDTLSVWDCPQPEWATHVAWFNK